MSAGCLTLGRSLLGRAQWLAEQDESAQLSVVEDPRVVAQENLVYEGLASQATHFITSLDEVGSLHPVAASPCARCWRSGMTCCKDPPGNAGFPLLGPS